MRADFGITYDTDALKTIDELREWGITVRALVITRFDNQTAAVAFKNRLERRNIRVYTHRATKGYPTSVDTIVSEEGYGANPCIETERPIVVITGPGASSGKLATCLSQLYHEHQRGRNASYAKFGTFPISKNSTAATCNSRIFRHPATLPVCASWASTPPASRSSRQNTCL